MQKPLEVRNVAIEKASTDDDWPGGGTNFGPADWLEIDPSDWSVRPGAQSFRRMLFGHEVGRHPIRSRNGDVTTAMVVRAVSGKFYVERDDLR